MSFAILAIGAAHSIPPIAGAVIGKTKTSVYVGAVIGAVIAFASGNPAFIAADLLGVGAGIWLGLVMVRQSSKVKAQDR
jgi:hypothetical protein